MPIGPSDLINQTTQNLQAGTESGLKQGTDLAQAGDRLQALKLQNQQAQQDVASKQLSGSLSMANTYLRANDTVRKQMRGQLLDRANQNGAPINGLLDAFDADPTLGRQWLIQSQQPGFDEKIRSNPFLANQIAASDDVMGVMNHTQEFLATAKGEQATSKAVEVATLKGEYAGQNLALKNEAQKAKDEAKAATGDEVKQDRFLTSTQALLESARGAPAIATAEKDIYASKKIKTLADQIGNLNLANPAQVHLITTEVAKLAAGGATTDAERRGIVPSGIGEDIAGLLEKITNNPTPANQGALLKKLTDYGEALNKDAKSTVNDKYTRVLNVNRKRIGEDNYQMLHDNYVKALLGEDAPGASKTATAPTPKNYSAYIKAARAGANGAPPLSDAQIKDNLIHMYGATAEQVDAQLGGR